MRQPRSLSGDVRRFICNIAFLCEFLTCGLGVLLSRGQRSLDSGTQRQHEFAVMYIDDEVVEGPCEPNARSECAKGEERLCVKRNLAVLIDPADSTGEPAGKATVPSSLQIQIS